MAKSKKFYSTKVESNEPDCESCGLSAVCKSPKLKFIGKGKKNVLIIGSQPTSREDLKGELGYGDEAVFLESALEEIGIDFYEDCFYTTTVGCRPPRDRRPGTAELKACRKRLDRIIERLDPTAVILLGEIPFNYMIAPRISGRLTGTPAKDFYSCKIPDQELGRWLVPTWSVQDMLERKQYSDGGMGKPLYQRDEAWYRLWKNSIKQAFTVERFEKIDYEKQCKITQDIDTAIDWICEALDWEEVALDDETSGLSLRRKGHFIACRSISNGVVSYAFPEFDDPTYKRMWKRLMTEKKIKKIAHNLQYENTADKVINKFWILGWMWDTMLSAHILHNKQPCGLKYQTYINFGVLGYDDECAEYLGADKAEVELYGSNAINRIHNAPMEKVLLYNALDSLFTFMLYKLHKSKMSLGQLRCNELYVNTAVTLSKMSDNGIYVKEEAFETMEKQLNDLLIAKDAEIMADDIVKKWDSDEPFNFNSTTQLGHLLFDIVGINPIAFTDKGTPSLDKEAMGKMNIPLLNKIIEYREIDKLKTTYIEGWKRECVDNLVHAQFLLHTVDTGRSSSSNPNFQNQPKRNKEAKKVVRSLVSAKPGFVICEYDFHGLETYTNMFYSKDPAYKKYLSDPDSDMHADLCTRLFCIERDEVTKEWRQATKSQTFALTYGSYYVQIAKDMWEYIQSHAEVKAHFAKKGVTSYAQYELIAKDAENYFWHDMFKVHDKWRKNMWTEYQKKGYLDSYTGFRLQAPLDYKHCFNYLPQGTGAQCLFYVINHMQDKIDELGLESTLIGEIHDSVVGHIKLEEEHLIDYWMHYFASVKMKEDWSWISIPLIMEKERGEEGGTWAKMSDCGALTGGPCMPKV